MSDYHGYNAKQILDLISAFYQIADKEIAESLKIKYNSIINLKRGYRKFDEDLLNNIFLLYPLVKQAIEKTSDTVSESHIEYEKDTRDRLKNLSDLIKKLEDELHNKEIIIKALIRQVENNTQKKE